MVPNIGRSGKKPTRRNTQKGAFEFVSRVGGLVPFKPDEGETPNNTRENSRRRSLAQAQRVLDRPLTSCVNCASWSWALGT